MPSGLPFSTMIAGPYHQAGPVKLTTFRRSGVTWMFVATMSMRFEIIAGMSCPNGMISYLMVFTPIQSSTAWWISTSIPLATLVAGSIEL